MDVNTIVTLKLIGFDELEQANLKAVLTLAERALHQPWQVVESSSADFYLLSVGSVAQISQQPELQALPKTQCILCVTQADTVSGHTLLMDKNKIPGLRALVDVLNRVSTATKTQATIEHDFSVTVAEPKTDTSFFEPYQGLLAYLLNPSPQYLVITLNTQIDCLALYVDTHAQVYYSHNTLAQLDSYLTAGNNLCIKSYAADEFSECIEAESLKPQPLKNLIWYAALSLSAGRVLKNHADNVCVRLKSWPDLRLPNCMQYAKLATFMKNHHETLAVIAAQTDTALADVHNFYNACYLIDITA